MDQGSDLLSWGPGTGSILSLQSRWRLKPGDGTAVRKRVFPAQRGWGTAENTGDSGIAELSEADVKHGGWPEKLQSPCTLLSRSLPQP